MILRLLADLTVLVHLGFVLFVVAGGWLVRHRPGLAWLHIPAVLWAVYIEWSGGICPLTPLENWLRTRSGAAGYAGGFVEHYLIPVLYPDALTRPIQFALGAAVVLINLWWYRDLLRRH